MDFFSIISTDLKSANFEYSYAKKEQKNFGVIEYIYEYMLELVECKFARNGLKVLSNGKGGGWRVVSIDQI